MSEPAALSPRAVRDRQRRRLYDWEDRTIAPADPASVPFALAGGMVGAIWSELGLRFPPAVERLPRQSRCMADATRLAIRLPERFPSWCLLHELAHSLTSTHDGASDLHGARFLGVYVQLLARYMRLNPAALAASAVQAGLLIDANARPVFVDTHPVQPRDTAKHGIRGL